MPVSLDQLEQLAPDQASLAAARKLLQPAGWPTLAQGEGLAWGECQGSGATPYRVVISEADAGYKCTCPSRKFPCKHSLALMWMRAEGKPAFTPAPVPEWVKDWQSRRRPGTAATEKDDKPRPSLALAQEAADLETDAKSEARAAAARERNRLDREESIAAGLEELDLWLTDQVDRGMAAFVAVAGASCRLLAQRMVDAKAPGLASRLETLPARLFTLPEQARPAAAVEELGQLYLLRETYRRQDALPPALRADVRQAVGWTTTREALLEDATALRITAIWRVIATRSEVQPDRLRRLETWLLQEGEEQFALLLDFVPTATGAAAGGYVAGDRLEAELVFYPSVLPLRAQIVQAKSAAACADPMPLPTYGLPQALERLHQALAQLPWLGTWPIAFSHSRLRRVGEELVLLDDLACLPLLPAQSRSALPLAALDELSGMGLWNGDHLTLCWAETAQGRWVNA